MSEPARTTFAKLIHQGILEIGDGYRAKLDELGGNGPIFLRAGLVTEQGISWNEAERFRSDLIEAVKSKLGHPGDTMVTTKGNSIGRAGYVSNGSPLFVYSPHLSYWRSSNSALLSPGYLRYWAHSPEFADQLRAMAGSTDMAPYLSLSDQRRLVMTLPAPRDQQAMADLLSALDNKITVNNQICVTSDELIRQSYAYISASASEVIKIDRFAYQVRDTVPAESLTDEDKYIGLEHMPRRNIWLTEWDMADTVVSAKTRFHCGDILFGKLRPYFHKVGIALVNGVSSTDILVIRPRRDSMHGWLLAVLSSDDVVEHASAIGDGTRMPRAKWSDLAAYQVPWPGDDRAWAFNQFVSPIVDRIRSAAAENRALAELRDSLLPRLMSGEIRVREAEKVVGEVT